MIVQMSKKSKIYHRDGCCYIDRISEDSLTAFDIEDEMLKDFRMCKCCGNMKFIYNNLNPKSKLELEYLGSEVEAKRDAWLVKTPSYRWQVSLKPSTQELKLYLGEWIEEWHRYSWNLEKECEKSRDLHTIIRFIKQEERLSAYPIQYRKYVSKIEHYAMDNQVNIQYDGTDLYVLTDVAAWKIAYGYHYNWFKLLHCPFGDKTLTIDEAKSAHYHVQMDVPRNQSPYKHIQYIVEHDKAKKIEQIDYRKLPNKTKKQKKYYRQAQNRARRRSVSRVLDLLAGI